MREETLQVIVKVYQEGIGELSGSFLAPPSKKTMATPDSVWSILNKVA